VSAAMERMENIIQSMARLRGELHGSAQELTLSEDELRATRLRIGRAIDELASDESKLARSLEAERSECRAAEDSVNGTIHALLARPPIGEIALRRGHALSDDDAIVLQGLSMIIDTLREAHTRATKLRRIMERKRTLLDDLRFQMAQLKRRLAAMNAESSTSLGITQERVQSAEARLRGELDRLLAEAELVSSYVRGGSDDKPPQKSVEP
jgi:predicted  nucleic acid-binding Zn-ribbon protein